MTLANGLPRSVTQGKSPDSYCRTRQNHLQSVPRGTVAHLKTKAGTDDPAMHAPTTPL